MHMGSQDRFLFIDFMFFREKKKGGGLPAHDHSRRQYAAEWKTQRPERWQKLHAVGVYQQPKRWQND